MNFTQKEQLHLNDLKKHEELCIKKYNTYASQTRDPQLKQIFTNLARQEQKHLNTINGIISGQVPDMSQQSQQGQQAGQGQQGQQAQQAGPMMQNQNAPNVMNAQMPSAIQGISVQSDADMCSDMLATEKYVSSAYNTSIFEFNDHKIREALNHIQKEEQQHGEDLYNYLKSKGMY